MLNETVKDLARDLTKDYPRSPRELLAGYVLAARVLDKCRAEIAGMIGEYYFICPLDRMFFNFTGIDALKFKEFVATGVSDAEVEKWIQQHASERSRESIVEWNNNLRYKRINELPIDIQIFLEDYIPVYVAPKGRTVYYWFDVYDIEEERI